MATSTHTVNLGKLGFNTRKWSSSTAYTNKDFVVYENSLYTALTDVPAGTLPTDTNYFLCVCKGITPRGAYDSNETYDINNVVIYNNNSYWCKADGVTATPSDTTYWMPIPSPSLNSGFGIGNRYAVVPADSDLVGLWNLIPANSVIDGTEHVYGMTASTNVFRPIVTIVDQAPFHDPTIAYRINSDTTNKRLNDSGRHVSTSLCVFDTVGTVRTFRFLAYLTSYSYNYLNFVTPSRVSSDYPSSSVYGFQCGVSGNKLWCGLRNNSNDRMFFNASSSDSSTSFRYMTIPNDVNEFVFVVERTSSGYSYDSYVNGVKFKTGTSTYNYNATVTDMYLGVVNGSNYPEYYSRGLVQAEIYTGAKITADYTPQYQLLSEPSI